MSDRPERRQDTGEIRERLVAVEAELRELPRVRERVHALAQCTQQLVDASETAAESRKQIQFDLVDLGRKIQDAAIASARTETQLGATMAAHIEQCKTDKAEIKTLVTSQLEKQDKMHNENKAAINKLEVRLALYLGIALTLIWAISHGEVIAKIIK